MWFKKNHHLTVLANPQFLDWRHFGQNPETIRFLYLQRCRTSGAVCSYYSFYIHHSTFIIHHSKFIIHHSTFRYFIIRHFIIRQFDIRQFDISTFIILNFRKSTALPQIKSSVANYVAMCAMWFKKNHHFTVLANPQFPDWRHFGQNPETIRFLYLQRCRTSGAISSYSSFIIRQFDSSTIRHSSSDISSSDISSFDSSTFDSSTVRQFDISSFQISVNQQLYLR